MNPATAYFPDGPPIANGEAFSPLTSLDGDPGHGANNVQIFPMAPDPPRQSAEQGRGRSPGQQWPHMPHVLPFNLLSLSNMGWHPYTELPERVGWSAPTFYEQSPYDHFGVMGPVALQVAPSMTYTEMTMGGQ